MSQRIEKNSQPGSENANKVDLSVKKSHNTEATHTPESKARAHAEKAEKLEKAKKTIEHQKQKEQKEKHQPVSKKDLEKPHPTAEKKDPSSYTPSQKKSVYKKEIKSVQSHLPRGSRVFSKIVHNPVIEKVSDVTAVTIFRPSALIGGSLAGLIFGIAIYVAAQYYGYIMPNWILVALLIAGALLGLILEAFAKLLTRGKHKH